MKNEYKETKCRHQCYAVITVLVLPNRGFKKVKFHSTEFDGNIKKYILLKNYLSNRWLLIKSNFGIKKESFATTNNCFHID